MRIIIGELMKKNCYYFLLLFLIISLSYTVIFGDAVISNFRCEAIKNKVILKWSTLSEVNCKEFVIERSLDQKNFKKIGVKKAAGNSSEIREYAYHDNTVFRTNSNIFYYQIKIIDNNDQVKLYSERVSISPSISSVRHTWGSIKAMFR